MPITEPQRPVDTETIERPTYQQLKQYDAIELRESEHGVIYLLDHRPGGGVYSGIEKMDAGNGVPLLILAAMNLLDGADLEPVEVLDMASQQVRLIAGIELSGSPDNSLIMIFPFHAGPAGRRLFALPTLDGEAS